MFYIIKEIMKSHFLFLWGLITSPFLDIVAILSIALTQ